MNYDQSIILTIQRLFEEKYYNKLMEEGSNVIALEPDIAKAFHNSASNKQNYKKGYILRLTSNVKRHIA